jgi:hypothetical protein
MSALEQYQGKKRRVRKALKKFDQVAGLKFKIHEGELALLDIRKSTKKHCRKFESIERMKRELKVVEEDLYIVKMEMSGGESGQYETALRKML